MRQNSDNISTCLQDQKCNQCADLAARLRWGFKHDDLILDSVYLRFAISTASKCSFQSISIDHRELQLSLSERRQLVSVEANHSNINTSNDQHGKTKHIKPRGEGTSHLFCPAAGYVDPHSSGGTVWNREPCAMARGPTSKWSY
jgi:hypothetical protein